MSIGSGVVPALVASPHERMPTIAAHNDAFRSDNTLAWRSLAPVLGAIACAAFVGLGVARSLGWLDASASAAPALLGAASWSFAAILGACVLHLACNADPRRLGFGVLAASGSRMLIALFTGLFLFFAMNPDGKTFWSTFLIAGIFALVAEAVWSVLILNRINRASGLAARAGSGV